MLLPDPATWFARVLAGPGIRLPPFGPEIAMAAFHLPEPPHGDPADRLLIATARATGLPIVTRDRRIIGYSEPGRLSVIAC